MKTRIFVCFAVIHVWSFGNAIFVKEALLRHILDELATLKNAVLEQQPYEHQKDSERESSREKTEIFLPEAHIPSRGRRDILNFKRLLTPVQKIGFTAVRHSNSAVHGNEIIVFGTSITNVGSAYNPTSGIFTAPVNGMYVFFYDLECMKTNGDTYVKLMKNAANTGIESYCHGLGDIDNSSTLGVLYLEAGDMVSIRLSNSDSKIFGYKTIFSGFLI